MKYSENAINIIAACTYKGIGKAWIVQNIIPSDTSASIIPKLNSKLKEWSATVNEFENLKNTIKSRIALIADFVDGITAFGDNDFPYVRGEVKGSEQPIILYYKGDLSLLNADSHNVAVIGLLNPDQTTIDTESAVVHELVAHGHCIVSGLAQGCDSIAHKQTLIDNGKTVAILPSSLKNILPSQNKQLAQDILDKGGLLITEYGKDASSDMELRGRYQERDRLQALFSDAIILSASYAKNDQGNDSGSRLAMEYARKYQIPRYVMYDEQQDATNPKYDLSRQILREGDAQIVNANNVCEKINVSRTSLKKAVQTELF